MSAARCRGPAWPRKAARGEAEKVRGKVKVRISDRGMMERFKMSQLSNHLWDWAVGGGRLPEQMLWVE